jgi:hypothetical protein
VNQLSSSVTDSGAAVAWLIVVYIVLAAAVVLFVAGVISVARAPGLTSMARPGDRGPSHDRLLRASPAPSQRAHP